MSTRLVRLFAVVSFAGLVWMAYWLVFVTGYRDYFFVINERGQVVVSDTERVAVSADRATPLRIEGGLGIADARDGDILLSYDGIPISQSDFVLHSNGLPSPTASVGLDRDGKTFTIVFEKYPGSFSHVAVRWALIVVAAVAWLLGVLAIWVYAGQNPERVLFASWCFAIALWLVGDRSIFWTIPLSRTASATLGPLLAPMYIDLALRRVGWRSAPFARWALRVGYGIASIAAVAGLILVVGAEFSTVALLGLFSFYDWVFPLAGLSLLVGPAILALGALGPIVNRRLLAWSALLTAVAVLPSLVLDILPTLGGAIPRYRDVPITLFVVLPIVYGYLIFRANNFQLDGLISRTAILLLIGITAVLVFAVVDVASGGGADESLLIALMTALLVLVLVGVLHERFQDPLERVLFGKSHRLQQAVIELTASLPTVNEESDLVKMALVDIPGKLGVSSAELFLVNRSAQVTRFTPTNSVTVAAFPAVPKTSILLHQSSHDSLWADFPSAGAILTVAFRGTPVGLVFIDRKPQDEPFNLKEIQFLESVLPLIELGFERIWLNDAQEEALIQEIGNITKSNLDIANDLHDGPVALLEAALLHIDDLRTGDGDGGLSRLDQTTREAIRQIRSIVDSVRPRILTESTKLILQEAADSYRRSAPGTHFESHIDLDYDTSLSLPANDALYRIIRGALQNVREHSKASKVHLRAHRKDNTVVVTIEDNGVGLARTHSLTRTELVKDGHFGIQFFYDYAASAGGICRVGPAPSGGTCVEVILPILQATPSVLPGPATLARVVMP